MEASDANEPQTSGINGIRYSASRKSEGGKFHAELTMPRIPRGIVPAGQARAKRAGRDKRSGQRGTSSVSRNTALDTLGGGKTQAGCRN
jgi:hypothetical protein